MSAHGTSRMPDPSERLSEDDQATQRDAEFLELAMRVQRQRAEAEPAAEQGVCTNCGDRCLPLAVYCDDECRNDHEKRQAAKRRTGATVTCMGGR